MTKEEWKAWFKARYANKIVFAYNQIEELQKTFKFRNSHGVCYGMSTDWLRRKMFNDHNPDGKQKRNFDDGKYWWRYNRVRLTKKHGALQAAYGAIPLQRPQNIQNRMAQVLPDKGLEKINIEEYGRNVTFSGDYSWNSYKGMIDDMEADSGQLGHLRTDKPIHVVAVHKKEGGRIEVFDPNFGEYGFATSLTASGFIFDLCDGYRRFHLVGEIRFNEATWHED
jgi:hypothetical protein